MKEIFLLTKVLLKSSITTNSQKKQIKNTPFKYIGFAILYLYLAGVIGFISFEMISSLKLVNQEAVFLSLCLMAILGMNIMRALFTSINVLFFSKDIEYLLPLPVKSYKLIIAKINCLIISDYLASLVISVPALVVYGFVLKLNLMFYILGILVLLLLPVIPIMLVSLIMTIIMCFTNIIRNKDFVQYISIILVLVIVIGIQFLTGADQNITNEELANMLVEANGLATLYTEVFFSLKPAFYALLNYDSINGILNLGILFLETLCIYVIGIFIMSKFYIKTVTNIKSSVFTKKKQNTETAYFQKSILKAYTKKEFQILTRNPIFFMQCVLPSILFPFIFLMPTYMGLTNGDITNLEQIKSVILEYIFTPIGIAVSIAILVFFYMFNYISITCISRDGENATFMKYIPISLKKQCFYKILPGIIMNLFPIIYINILLKVLYWNENITIPLLWINIIGILLNIINNYWMVLIDLKKPKLHWTTEYAVVKQNLNMFWEIVICVVQICIIVIWGNFLQNIQVFSISVCLLLVFCIKHIQNYIKTNEKDLFEKII